jgi:hypothetical protein
MCGRGGAPVDAAKQRKGRQQEEGEVGTDRWGRCVTDHGKKKRRRGDAGRCGKKIGGPLRKEDRWAGCGKVFFFFLFVFPNTNKTKLLNSNSIQIFSNFFTKVYKFFKPHTSNQNHA